MKRKRKKGSSIVIVIFITTIIITTATTLLALVTGDYKARINQSKELQNLYGAESGLNYVYNIIEKEAESATVIANNQVYNLMTNDSNARRRYLTNYFSSGQEYNYKLLNGLFQSYFIKALLYDDALVAENNNTNIINSINSLTYRNIDKRDGETDEDYSRRMAGIFTPISLDRSETLLENDTKIISMNVVNPNAIERNVFTDNIDNFTTIEALNNAINNYVNNQYITLEVESTFKDPDGNSTKLNNTKTIRTKFTIKAPNYQQGINGQNSYDNYYKYPVIKILAADKNINVDDSTVNISDDIWIGGLRDNQVNSNTAISQKYNNGLIIDNSTVNFAELADIYTNGSVSLLNSSTLNNYSDIYALNVYSGAINRELQSKNNLLKANNIITDNDLAMNSTNSNFRIGNYYGINDKTFNSNDVIVDNEIISAAKQSSSIIVNNPNGDNSIDIGTAYVNGVAYIDLPGEEKYQTGESVAIKGNVVAYTDSLNGEEVTFKRYGAYSLIEGDVNFKKNHFASYYNNNEAISGGVSIDRLYAIGASVNEKNQAVNLNQDEGTINNLKSNYSINVLNLGYDYDEGTNVIDRYNTGLLQTSLANSRGNSKINFNLNNNEVFTSLPNVLNHENMRGYSNFIYAPYDEEGNQPETIYITRDGIKIGRDGDILIRPQVNGTEVKYSGLIFTAGNIEIDGSGFTTEEKLVFDGSLVAGGNININNVRVDFTFNQDRAYFTIMELTAEDEVIREIFTTGAIETEERVQTGTSFTQDLSSIGGYDAKKFLKIGLWKLVR